jgi:hypothetical protein
LLVPVAINFRISRSRSVNSDVSCIGRSFGMLPAQSKCIYGMTYNEIYHLDTENAERIHEYPCALCVPRSNNDICQSFRHSHYRVLRKYPNQNPVIPGTFRDRKVRFYMQEAVKPSTIYPLRRTHYLVRISLAGCSQENNSHVLFQRGQVYHAGYDLSKKCIDRFHKVVDTTYVKRTFRRLTDRYDFV